MRLCKVLDNEWISFSIKNQGILMIYQRDIHKMPKNTSVEMGGWSINGGQIVKVSNTKYGIIDKSSNWIYDQKF